MFDVMEGRARAHALPKYDTRVGYETTALEGSYRQECAPLPGRPFAAFLPNL